MSSPILLLLFLSALCASALISDDHQVVVNQQVDDAPKKRCLFKFENLNYTIIKGQCKAPEYPYNPCCDAFKNFACPFVEYIDDNTTTCADDMFDSLETLGNFPTDLFVRMCRDADDNTIISCPAPPPSDQNADENAAAAPPPIFMLQLFILLLLFFNFSKIRM